METENLFLVIKKKSHGKPVRGAFEAFPIGGNFKL